LIELAGRLKEYRNIGIVVCFSKLNDEDEKYLEYLKKKAGELGISSKAFFWIKERPFYPILRFADIFLRPTNTDGDAISVREALYLGVPVVASDVVERPHETLIFKNRNIDDLEEKVRTVIENIGQNRTMPRECVCRRKGGDIDAYLEFIKNQFGGDS
jgi:glycosyltransferase involved in cell wall biosynthesis